MKKVFGLFVSLCLVIAAGRYVPVQAQEAQPAGVGSCALNLSPFASEYEAEMEYYRLTGCLEGQLALAKQRGQDTRLLELQLQGLYRLKQGESFKLTYVELQRVTTVTIPQPVTTSTTTITIRREKVECYMDVIHPMEKWVNGQPGPLYSDPLSWDPTYGYASSAFQKFGIRQNQILTGQVVGPNGNLLYYREPDLQSVDQVYAAVAGIQKFTDLERYIGHWVMDYTHGGPKQTRYVRETRGEIPDPAYLKAANGWQLHFTGGMVTKITANLYGGNLTLRRAPLKTKTWVPGVIQYMVIWRNADAYKPEHKRSTCEDERPLQEKYPNSASFNNLTPEEERSLHAVVHSYSRKAAPALKVQLQGQHHDVYVDPAMRLHAPYNYTEFHVTLYPHK